MPIELRHYDWTTDGKWDKAKAILAIRLECAAQGLTLAAQVAYVLATVEWETSRTFAPVREGLKASEAWRKRKLRYFPYYGRGFVQITWEFNYKQFSELLNIDLVDDPRDPNDNLDPDRALDPDVALFILVYGFKNGLFTGKKITDYIRTGHVDFRHSRRCINGMDRAGEIAALAEKHLKAING